MTKNWKNKKEEEMIDNFLSIHENQSSSGGLYSEQSIFDQAINTYEEKYECEIDDETRKEFYLNSDVYLNSEEKGVK